MSRGRPFHFFFVLKFRDLQVFNECFEVILCLSCFGIIQVIIIRFNHRQNFLFICCRFLISQFNFICSFLSFFDPSVFSPEDRSFTFIVIVLLKFVLRSSYCLRIGSIFSRFLLLHIFFFYPAHLIFL